MGTSRSGITFAVLFVWALAPFLTTINSFVNGCTLAVVIAQYFFGDAISLSIRSGGVTSSAWAQFGFETLAVENARASLFMRPLDMRQ
jgi:hypothetical protein